MLTDQEIRQLMGSTSKLELKDKVDAIRASIMRTFSEKSPARPNLLKALEELAIQISSRLPDVSPRTLMEIEDDVASWSSHVALQDKIDKYSRQALISSDIAQAVQRGAGRWREKDSFMKTQELMRVEAIKRHELEEIEFAQLVDEVKALGFTESRQVSSYIIANKLSAKYKYISGILEMERDQDAWQYRGGFPPRIYARLCDAFGLGRKDSGARVKSFRAFSDVQNGFKS